MLTALITVLQQELAQDVLLHRIHCNLRIILLKINILIFFRSETFIQGVVIAFLENPLRPTAILLQVEDSLHVERSKWEALLLLLCVRAKDEVVLRVVAGLDVQVVIDELQEDTLELINLTCGELSECFGEVIVLETLIIPNFGAYYLIGNIIFYKLRERLELSSSNLRDGGRIHQQ